MHPRSSGSDVDGIRSDVQLGVTGAGTEKEKKKENDLQKRQGPRTNRDRQRRRSDAVYATILACVRINGNGRIRTGHVADDDDDDDSAAAAAAARGRHFRVIGRFCHDGGCGGRHKRSRRS